MKPVVVFAAVLAALLLSSGPASAQEYGKVDLEIGYGGYPALEKFCFSTPLMAKIDMAAPREGLASIYGISRGNMFSTGTLTFTADLPVREWFSVPFTIAGNICWQKSYDPCDDVGTTGVMGTVQILPGVKFKYMNRPRVNFYSSLALGVGLAVDSSLQQVSSDGSTVLMECLHYVELVPAFQVVPFGVRFGSKVYGFAEFGAGTLYLGGRIGLGFRL